MAGGRLLLRAAIGDGGLSEGAISQGDYRMRSVFNYDNVVQNDIINSSISRM